jgi:hypothetical protein
MPKFIKMGISKSTGFLGSVSSTSLPSLRPCLSPKLTATTPPTKAMAVSSINKPIHQDGPHWGKVAMGSEWGRIFRSQSQTS